MLAGAGRRRPFIVKPEPNLKASDQAPVPHKNVKTRENKTHTLTELKSNQIQSAVEIFFFFCNIGQVYAEQNY